MIHRWQDAAFEQEFLLRSMPGYLGELLDGYQEHVFDGLPEGVLKHLHGELFQRADPIYVSDDVESLWEFAADSFKPEQVHRTDLVVPCGFALLPRPFVIRDVYDEPVSFRAIGWLPVSQSPTYRWSEGEAGQGVWISLFSHAEDEDSSWGREHDPALFDEAIEKGWYWSLMHGAPMFFDEDGWDRSHLGDTENATVRRLWIVVQSFWRLMSQTVPTKERLQRQARKQRQRKKMVEDVTVLRLRRTSQSVEHDGTGEAREYSHRFVVSGHWRDQWYPSIKGHRQIWISPYVKGPEDRPLIIKKRGVDFSR